MYTSRRGLILGFGALVCAPAIVRASSLMKVKALPTDDYLLCWKDSASATFRYRWVEEMWKDLYLTDGWGAVRVVEYNLMPEASLAV